MFRGAFRKKAPSSGIVGGRAIAASAARSLRSHPVPTLRANLNRNDRSKQRIASALAILVGVVQDFLALSGYTLSAAVRTAVATRVADAGRARWVVYMLQGAVSGAARVTGRLGGGGAARLATDQAWKFTVHLVYLFLVKPRNTEISKASVERFMQRSKGSIMALVNGKDIDLRPLVSDLVMSMGSVDVQNTASGIVGDILQEYVYTAYKSSSVSQGGFMCTLCSSVRCASGPAAAKGGGAVHGERLAALAGRVLKAVNMVLETRGTTFTRVVRAATDTYIRDTVGLRAPLPRAVSGAVNVAGVAAVYGTVPLGVAGLTGEALVAKARGQQPVLSRKLAAFGVDISQTALGVVLAKHSLTLVRFVARDPAVNIENMILDILRRTDPIGATRGVLTAAVTRRGTSEFCRLCTFKYRACML